MTRRKSSTLHYVATGGMWSRILESHAKQETGGTENQSQGKDKNDYQD